MTNLNANYVGVDDEAIGSLATKHLISVGCKRIAHLRGPETSPGIGRLNGYLSALRKNKMTPLPGYVTVPRMVDVNSRESGVDLMKQLIKLKPRPDGVFCFNDPMAMGAIHAILDAGLRIPDDIAVIGSGNLHYDSELHVPLSSVDQQTEMVGKCAARVTLSLLESKKAHRAQSIVLQPKLVVRASSKKEHRVK